MIRILTKNGVDNTNVDGARDHNFNAGRRSGIVQGALNQGNFFASNNNTIALDTCELRLCGHRIVLDKAEYRTFTNKPSVPVRYSFVARVVVDSDDNVSFEFVSKEATTQLVQDNLDITGSGTFELEIGKFTQLTDGNITDVVRTADLITGGAGGGDSEYIRIGTVTTNKISPELDADVDIENTINPTDNKPQTNFTFNLPTAVGTVVSVNGEEKTAINTDLTPTANSENLITSGGVHDYPAITFAESERQKSKNLFDLNYNGTFGSTTEISVSKYISLKSIYGEKFTINTNLPQYSFTRGNIGDIFTNIIFNNLKPSTSYTISFVPISVTTESTSVHFLGVYNVQDRLGTKVTTTITTDENGRFNTDYGIWISAQNTTFTVSNVQLEEGSVATDYQPYNGAILHEKEIQDVEHIKTIYDMFSSDSNINWGKTSGIKAIEQVEGVLSFTSPIALNVNKKYRIYVNWGGDINIFTASVNHSGTIISGCSATWSYLLYANQLQMCEFQYLSNINQIQFRFRNLTPGGASVEIQTSEYVYITKIEEMY